MPSNPSQLPPCRMEEQLLRLPQVAKALNCSLRTVGRLLDEGHLQRVYLGRAVRIRATGEGSLAAFVTKGGAR